MSFEQPNMMSLAAAIVMGFVVLCTADITVMMMAEGQAHQVNFYVENIEACIGCFLFSTCVLSKNNCTIQPIH